MSYTSLTSTAAYDPQDVALVVAGLTITGFMDGTFVTIARAEDASFMKVGAQGDWSFGINRNRSGTMSFVIQQTARSINSALISIVAAGEATGNIEHPVSFVDPTGLSLPSNCTCAIKKMGDYTNEANNVTGITWELYLTDAILVEGDATGAVQTVLSYL